MLKLNLTNDQILEKVKNLDDLYQKFLTSKDYDDADEYSKQVYVQTEMYMYATDYRIQGFLAQHWVNRLSVFSQFRRVDVYSTESIKRTLGLLSYPAVTEKILTSPENRLVLAYLCLRMTQESNNTSMRLPNADARHVLDIWSGNPISTEDVLCLEKVTTLLYGPVVWDLYRQEVTEEYEWPNFLFKQGFPVTLPSQACATTTPLFPVELPADI